MKCKRCGTGQLIIYTEMMFTCQVPFDESGELDWQMAEPTHDPENAHELEGSMRELICDNTTCRATWNETGYRLSGDELEEISGA